MFTTHHSLARGRVDHEPRRTKKEFLVLACKLRGITLDFLYKGNAIRKVTMTTPDGTITSHARGVGEAFDNYHNDVAFHELPLITPDEDGTERA